MATKRALATIFTYFETGDVPTQVQYEDAWFSMRHKDDPVLISEVTDLANVITGIAATKTNGQTISIPAGGYVDKIFVKSASAGDVKIESGSGLENVVPLTTFTAGQSQFFRCDFWNNTGSAMTLTFTTPGSVTVRYMQQVITL
jgi:hypothetical protein